MLQYNHDENNETPQRQGGNYEEVERKQNERSRHR